MTETPDADGDEQAPRLSGALEPTVPAAADPEGAAPPGTDPPRGGTDAPAGLDLDAAISDAGGRRPDAPAPVIDTRRYQRMIGAFGLTLVLAFSIYLFARGGNGTPGVAPGQRLHPFVAPLATSNLAGVAANAHPVCNPARPARRGLNVCDRRPLVLAFFALGEKACIAQVDTLQAVAPRFPRVQFAAVALAANKRDTAALVRRHGWTRVSVAYDLSDTIGEVYGIEVCPLIEIARPGGIVQQRLIGKDWLSATNLARAVAKLGR